MPRSTTWLALTSRRRSSRWRLEPPASQPRSTYGRLPFVIGPTLNDRVSEIRELVHGISRRNSCLVRDSEAWSRLCSAMDAIGDAELALDAHAQLVDGPVASDTDVLYLVHFGLVASLGIQHDSTKDLCRALGLSDLVHKVDVNNRFAKGIRNDVMHQSNRSNGQEFWSVSRAELTKQGFRLYGYGRDGRRLEGQWVECSRLVHGQVAALGPILDEAIKRMKNEDAEHRARFRDDVLAKLFQGYDHAVGSVKAASTDPDRNAQLGVIAIRSLREMATKLSSKLEERGEDENAKEDLADALAVLARAEDHCRAAIVSIDFRGVALLVEKVMTSLLDYALDVDKFYSEP